MTRTLALALALLAAGTARALGPIDLLGPTDLIGLVDHLTRSDAKTRIEAKPGTVLCTGKLVVARMRVDVELGRTSRNWRGTVTSTMTVPSEITYSIDLSSLRPEHVKFDPKKKLLVLAMPRPKVEAITPIMEDVRKENRYKAVRFRMLDSSITTELQNTMLLTDYNARARELAEAHASAAAGLGKPRVEEFLQSLLRKAVPGLTVKVE